MSINQELADAGRLVYGDVLAGADWVRAELKNVSSCANCGALEPVRVEAGVCSECAEFPRCVGCDRWVGDGTGWLPGYVNVLDEDGKDARLCEPCWNEVG